MVSNCDDLSDRCSARSDQLIDIADATGRWPKPCCAHHVHGTSPLHRVSAVASGTLLRSDLRCAPHLDWSCRAIEADIYMMLALEHSLASVLVLTPRLEHQGHVQLENAATVGTGTDHPHHHPQAF